MPAYMRHASMYRLHDVVNNTTKYVGGTCTFVVIICWLTKKHLKLFATSQFQCSLTYSRVNNEGSETNLLQTSLYGLLWYPSVF